MRQNAVDDVEMARLVTPGPDLADNQMVCKTKYIAISWMGQVA